MSRSRHLQVLIAQTIRFWLPLLLLALSFWIVGKSITRQVLNQPSTKPRALIANTQTNQAPTPSITAIDVTIDRQRGISLASVQLSNSTLRRQELEFSLTQPEKIEAAIAQELEQPLPVIKALVNYQRIDR
jgi:Na+-transporting methylmalonyl-CoA/oxaloacetate decarboxylase gamma subunit